MRRENKIAKRNREFIGLVSTGATYKAVVDAGFSSGYITARGGIPLVRGDIEKLGMEQAHVVALIRSRAFYAKRNEKAKPEKAGLIKRLFNKLLGG